MKRLILLIFISSLIIGCKKETFSLNVILQPPDCGIVNPMWGEYEIGDTVKIFVTPNEFYGFTWGGHWNNTQNPLTIVINGDRNLIANFFLLDTDGDGVTDNIDLCPDTPKIDDVDEQGCTIPTPLYLDDNGVTIKCLDWGITGEKYRYNHTDYLLVDEQMLQTMVNNYEALDHVCTSRVTDMSRLFYEKTFLSDISSWDVSNVIIMDGMFNDANFFSLNISNWDVSNVTSMSAMFSSSNFHGDISNWDVSNVTSMSAMFSTSNFNGDISNWDVSNVTDMNSMFSLSKFNGDISNWDVSNVTNMRVMFVHTPFNGNISNWDVSNVTNMSGMFEYTSFNSDISNWDVSNVTYFYHMFRGSSFNGNISNWDVSNAINMSYIFSNTKFNGNISSWDVSNVLYMNGMFLDNEHFNQDLSNWNVSKVISHTSFDLNTTAWVLPKPNFY